MGASESEVNRKVCEEVVGRIASAVCGHDKSITMHFKKKSKTRKIVFV